MEHFIFCYFSLISIYAQINNTGKVRTLKCSASYISLQQSCLSKLNFSYKIIPPLWNLYFDYSHRLYHEFHRTLYTNWLQRYKSSSLANHPIFFSHLSHVLKSRKYSISQSIKIEESYTVKYNWEAHRACNVEWQAHWSR